jgi:glucan phosphoethanolaminetransferase (alkaline phosphatase superfamily)
MNKGTMIIAWVIVVLANIFIFTMIQGLAAEGSGAKMALAVFLTVLLVVSDIVLIRKLRKRRK